MRRSVHPGFVAFVRLSRLKFLVGGLAGGALGTAIAAFETGHFAPVAYMLAQATITAAHLMTQYANDFYDRESDARTTRTPYSGGSGALVDGSLAPVVALRAAVVCLSVSVGGIVALFESGHALAGLIAAAIVPLAWAYSAPPVRLLARGLGELDTALVVAVLVPLCAYAAQRGILDVRAIASTLPGGVAMFAMMICVQVPDIAADAATGKRNLVVRLGKARAAVLALGTLAMLGISAVVAWALGAPVPFFIFEIIALAQGLRLARALDAVRRGQSVPAVELARSGVLLFASVAVFGALGYALAALSREAR